MFNLSDTFIAWQLSICSTTSNP